MKIQLIKLASILALSLVGIASPSIAQQNCKADDVVETAPAARFTDNADGTVTDQQTGLIWAQCLQGFQGPNCNSETGEFTYTWAQALALTQATSDTQANRTDWRLPDIKELASLVELACIEPTINETVFPGSSGSFVWSSSPFAFNAVFAWGVNFNDGITSTSNSIVGQSVRLVRGGQ